LTLDGAPVSAPSGSYFWMGNLADQITDGSGLQYRRNRYYDPQTGRFTQSDPIGIAGGINLYGFAGGDPVNHRDPFGLSAKDIEVQSHPVAGRANHASIRITPDDQERWCSD